jgi:SAM-dependent methyltransferase
MSQGDDDMEAPNWDGLAATWDDKVGIDIYADRAFRALTEHVVPLVPPMSSIRVLDFGGGTGQLTVRLSPRVGSVVALDVSSAMVEVLRSKASRSDLANVTPIVGDLEQGDDRRCEALRSPFDLIVASSVCAFLAQYRQTLGVLAGLLKPGGLFVQWDWQPDDDEPGLGLSAAQMSAAYQQVGLEPLRAAPTFEMDVEGKTMDVIMGVARKPAAAI